MSGYGTNSGLADTETDAPTSAPKTRYIVGVSHEIRTPLNSIFGYAQLLERGTASFPDTAVRVIRRSAEHLSTLIDGLLDVSKIENGMLRRELSYLPPQVQTDQKRLRQIPINLLSNAIKYTERGSVTLSVRYRSEIAEFEIADTGTGIAASDLERVFEPFERGHSEGVRAMPGTGLGLTITAHHGGLSPRAEQQPRRHGFAEWTTSPSRSCSRNCWHGFGCT